MQIQDFIEVIEDWSPPSQAEDFDNVGLLVGDSSLSLKGVLITLDTTEEIINEAIEKNCNLVVSFHPIIFSGLKKITTNSYVEKTVLKAIENKISIYSIHTSLDNHNKGVNYKISEKLSLKNSKILIPSKKSLDIGMGRIGELEKSLDENIFLNFIKTQMKTSSIRHSRLLNKKIKKVSVLGGSGAFAIKDSIEQKADAYVTSDLKYHNFFEANKQIVLIDIGHYESEQFTKNLIHDYLRKKIPNFAIILASTNTNPVNYF
mgnify:FL=1|tara:strand:- start:136 stop:918 length:783 start_codon:yes stop_codon:yes gene_type:complete